MAAIVASGGRLVDSWRLVKLLSDGDRLLLTLPGGKIARAGRWIRRADGYYNNAACVSDRFADWFRAFSIALLPARRNRADKIFCLPRREKFFWPDPLTCVTLEGRWISLVRRSAI
jgi:hypothetical protein